MSAIRMPFSLLTWYFSRAHADSAYCVWIPVEGSTKLSLYTTTQWAATLGTWRCKFLYAPQSSEWTREKNSLEYLGKRCSVSTLYNLKISTAGTVLCGQHSKYPQVISCPTASLILQEERILYQLAGRAHPYDYSDFISTSSLWPTSPLGSSAAGEWSLNDTCIPLLSHFLFSTYLLPSPKNSNFFRFPASHRKTSMRWRSSESEIRLYSYAIFFLAVNHYM